MARRTTSSDGSKTERRRTQRYSVAVPIEVSWRGPHGIAAKEQSIARQVNAHGGMLEMAHYPEAGIRVSLTNFLSAAMAEARVLATPNTREGVSGGIVVELIVPDESFWGVNLQFKKAAVELQKLESSLRAEGIDPRLLNEFRNAVDYIRTVAVTVQQQREHQLNGRDDSEVVAALVTERVRRAAHLCEEVIADADTGRMSAEIKGVSDLRQLLVQACDRLSLYSGRHGSERPASNRR